MNRKHSSPTSAGSALGRESVPLSPWFAFGALLLVAVVTFACFLPALSNEFVNWDDHIYLGNNPNYQGLDWERIQWMFTTFHGGPYQPLSWMTYGFDYLIWDMDATGYHLTSMVFHAASAAVLFLVAMQVFGWALPGCGRNGLICGAILSALLFGIHPLRAESVAWATERRDVVSGLFFLLAILFYLRWCKQRNRGGGVRFGWPVASFIACVLSLLSKGMGVSLPVVLLMLDWYPLRRWGRPAGVGGSGWPRGEGRRAALEKIPFFLVSLAFGVAAIVGVAKAGAISTVENLNAFERVVVSCYSMVFYLFKSLLPFGLSPLYEFPVNMDALHWRFLGCVPLFAGACMAIFRRRKRAPGIAAAWACYAVILFPVSGLLHAGPQLVADRYSYLATISLAILAGGIFALAWCRPGLQKQRAPLGVLAVSILVLLGGRTWMQTGIWRNSLTLWHHVANVNPESWNAHNNLGVCYALQGDLDLSLKHYQRSLAINPEYSLGYFNVGRLFERRGDLGSAVTSYEAALKFDPTLAKANTNLGNLLLVQNRPEEAVELYSRVLERQPDDIATLTNIGEALIQLERAEEAMSYLRRAVALDPKRIEAQFNLGNALERSGQIDQAAEQFGLCMEIAPDNLKSAEALSSLLVSRGRFAEAVPALRVVVDLSPADPQSLTNLGAALMDSGRYGESREVLSEALALAPKAFPTCLALSRLLASAPLEAIRDGKEAERLALIVCEGREYESPSALDALAASYAELGRFNDAAATALQAVRLARGSGRTALAEQIESRRALYLAGKPYRRGLR